MGSTNEDSERQTTKILLEQIKALQVEIERLKSELKRTRRIPSGKIGLALLIPGALSLCYSIIQESQILAFIGLGLTFWGALFFFVKPIRYVRSELLGLAELPSYLTIDRIIREFKFKGKSYYIPPYPREVYLPEHLKGLKEMIVFISSDTDASMPSVEDMAKRKFMLRNPNGICISPPGLGLLTQMEKELGKDMTEIDLETLIESLPQTATSDLQVAEEVEIRNEDNKIYAKISGSIYNDLYARHDLASIRVLGCPLISAIACALAKTTGRIVSIEKSKISEDGLTVESWYRFTEE